MLNKFVPTQNVNIVLLCLAFSAFALIPDLGLLDNPRGEVVGEPVEENFNGMRRKGEEDHDHHLRPGQDAQRPVFACVYRRPPKT